MAGEYEEDPGGESGKAGRRSGENGKALSDRVHVVEHHVAQPDPGVDDDGAGEQEKDDRAERLRGPCLVALEAYRGAEREPQRRRRDAGEENERA